MLPMMKNSPAGRIVIIGFNRSVFAKDAADGYARSEASIAELTRNLAAEIAQYGINANYIQLGAIMTPESRRVFNADKDLRDYCIQRSAAKRLGEPVDIAKVVLFLANDDSVFVSGTRIIVDGGGAGRVSVSPKLVIARNEVTTQSSLRGSMPTRLCTLPILPHLMLAGRA